MPTISVVTVNLNNASGLVSTIESVVNQTYTDIEYIIIDGGSNDGSQDIIKSYSANIAYWISEIDNGIYDAMNKGILAAKGEYICFINSGDLFLSPYSCEIVLNEFQKSHADIVFGDFLYCDLDRYKFELKSTPIIHDRSDLLKNYFAHPSTFYDRKLFLKVGLFDSNYKIAADVAWYLNAIINYAVKFAQLRFCVSVFFSGGISSTNFGILQQEIGEIIQQYYTNLEVRLFSGRSFKFLKNLWFTKKIFNLLFNLSIKKIRA